MDNEQRKRRTQGFYVFGLTTLAYVAFSVFVRDQPLSTFYYVVIAVGLICILIGAYFTMTDRG